MLRTYSIGEVLQIVVSQKSQKALVSCLPDSSVHIFNIIETRKSVVMYLSLVFDIDGYEEFLIACFFLTYSCTNCVQGKKSRVSKYNDAAHMF